MQAGQPAALKDNILNGSKNSCVGRKMGQRPLVHSKLLMRRGDSISAGEDLSTNLRLQFQSGWNISILTFNPVFSAGGELSSSSLERNIYPMDCSNDRDFTPSHHSHCCVVCNLMLYISLKKWRHEPHFSFCFLSVQMQTVTCGAITVHNYHT